MYKVDWLRSGWVPQTRVYRNKKAASAVYSAVCGAECVMAARLSVFVDNQWQAVSRCFRTASKETSNAAA
jgi:hypothetical protein